MSSTVTDRRPASVATPSRPDDRSTGGVIDIHQHLWPAEFIDLLRGRSGDVCLDGWTLHLPGEAPYQVDPADHDVEQRLAITTDCERVLLSMSSALSIETMAPEEAAPLLAAWDRGLAALPDKFSSWLTISLVEPDLQDLAERLQGNTIGLQIPATSIGSPAAVAGLAAVLEVVQTHNKPVFVHPGPVAATSENLPVWWPAVVDYPAQLQAAWWAWEAVGRSLLPTLRICFAAAAGLAPVHHERFAQRGGHQLTMDPLTFVDTSSYGKRGLDGLIRVLGIDPIVHGSDRPYAVPADLDLGPAATHAIRINNPRRLLEGGQP